MSHDGRAAAGGNGSHFGFLATSREQVDAFYAKALELGGKGDGAPSQRAHFAPQYCGAFMRDLDGHKIAPCSAMRRWGDFSQSCWLNRLFVQY